jgi:ABC-2 type transport system permease protein
MSPLLAQTWLILRNDLRLTWRDLNAGRWKDYVSWSLFVVLFLVANAISIAIFFAFGKAPPLIGETVAWLFFGSIMFTAAMNQAIRVLFERADFDLLLSSPVSPRAILLARLATMTVAAASSALLLLVPLINGLLLAISPRYTAGYAVWLLLSCALASAGVWLTLLLVKWLGPRRARTWAQVISAVLGAGLYLCTQSHNLLPKETTGPLFAWARTVFNHPATTLVARAGRAEWLALFTLAAITALFAALTTRLLSRMFIGGVQEAAGIAPVRRRGAARPDHFVEGVVRATFRKDVRLIVRDPLLLAQVLPTALYMLPAVFAFGRFGGVALLGSAALVIGAQFSFALTAVAAAGEECWDLIRMSPTAERRLRHAKMAAGMALPLVLCTILCLILALLGHPWLAVLSLGFSVACSAACAWLQVAQIKPTPRRDVLRRGSGEGNVGRGIMAAVIMMIGAAGLGCAATNHPIAAAVLLCLTALVVAACFALVSMEEITHRDFSSSTAGSETSPA